MEVRILLRQTFKYVHAKSLQSRLTLCDLMDRSPPGSSVHGIVQARILEWGAVPSSTDTWSAKMLENISGKWNSSFK